MDHRQPISGSPHKIPKRLSLNRRPPVSPEIESLVDQISLVQEDEKAEVTQILQSLTARLREPEYETRASF